VGDWGQVFDRQGAAMTKWAQKVREVVEEARRRAGSGPALAGLLEEAGVGPENGRYSESGISNWVKGRAMPPADVLLAAAAVGHVSLDSKLRAAEAPGVPGEAGDLVDVDQLAREVQDLRRQYGRLEAILIDLHSRTGQPYPHERPDEREQGKAVGT
jgi:transcriptional regulator with XRE-family HTH domain